MAKIIQSRQEINIKISALSTPTRIFLKTQVFFPRFQKTILVYS